MKRIRQRWLLTGREGSGKSLTAWYIAELYPTNAVYVLDTEDKHRIYAETRSNTPPNLHIQPVNNWGIAVDTYLAWKSQFKPGDWFFIDSAGLLNDYNEDDYRGSELSPKQKTGFGFELPAYKDLKPRLWAIINHALLRVLGLNVVIIAQSKPFLRVEDKQSKTLKVFGKKPDDIMAALDRFDTNPDAEASIKYNVATIVITRLSGTQFMAKIAKHPGYKPEGEEFVFTDKGLWVAFNKHLEAKGFQNTDTTDSPCL